MAKAICSPCNDMAGHDAETAELETTPFARNSVELQIGVLYSTVLRRVGHPDQIDHSKQKGVFTAIYYRGDLIYELTFRNVDGLFRLSEYTVSSRW